LEQSGKCLAQTPKLFGHAPKPCQTTAKPHPNCLAQTPKLFGFVSKLFGPTSKLFGLLWPNIAKLFGRQSQKYMPDHSGLCLFPTRSRPLQHQSHRAHGRRRSWAASLGTICAAQNLPRIRSRGQRAKRCAAPLRHVCQLTISSQGNVVVWAAATLATACVRMTTTQNMNTVPVCAHRPLPRQADHPLPR